MKVRNPSGFFIILVLCMLTGQAWAESSFLKLGTVLPPDHPTSQALEYFRQEIGNALDNQADIQFFPDAQLGTVQEILEGVRFGNIEIGVLPADSLVVLSPVLAAVSMPYIFRDEGHRFRMLDGPVGRQLLDSVEQCNLVGLGFFETGVRNIVTTQQHVTTPEDFHDKIIGMCNLCPEQDDQNLVWRLSAEAFTAFGATVESISPEDLAEKLRAEELDGWEGSVPECDRLKIAATEARYLTYSRHTVIPDVLVVSKIWFDTLSPETQYDIRNAARLTIQRQRKLWAHTVQEATTRLEEAGMTFETVDRELFYTAVQPVYTQMFEELGPGFEAMIRAIRAIR